MLLSFLTSRLGMLLVGLKWYWLGPFSGTMGSLEEKHYGTFCCSMSKCQPVCYVANASCTCNLCSSIHFSIHCVHFLWLSPPLQLDEDVPASLHLQGSDVQVLNDPLIRISAKARQRLSCICICLTNSVGIVLQATCPS